MTKIVNKSIDMIRLPYVLPEWTRMIWSSAIVRQTWEQKLQRASTIWLEIEERGVEQGIRPSALIFLDERAFIEKSMYYAKKGLVLQPLTRVNKSQSYSSSGSQEFDASKPTSFRCALTTPALVPEWIEAWEKSDNRKIGELLGFPSCCIEFFQRIWIDEKYVDTTWPMYQNTEHAGHFKANILLRWLGIRLVSHLPCSFECQESVKLATANLTLMEQLGHVESANDIINLLQMPIEWSAKHGIAEIKTPLFKISTRTDATSGLYVVQRPGEFYPDEAPSGTKFPYQNTQKNQITSSKSFQKSLAAVDPALEWTDNGFSSKEGMDREHANLVDQIVLLENRILDKIRSVIDLGCGNGKLLEQLRSKLLHIQSWSGVEIDFDRAKRAQFRNPEFSIFNTDIFSETWFQPDQFDIGIISFNRLLEREMQGQNWDHLFKACRYVVVYSYDDPKTLDQLIDVSGLSTRAKVIGEKVKLVTLNYEIPYAN